MRVAWTVVLDKQEQTYTPPKFPVLRAQLVPLADLFNLFVNLDKTTFIRMRPALSKRRQVHAVLRFIARFYKANCRHYFLLGHVIIHL